MITWLFTAASLTGAFLNAKGKIWGFYVWIPANLCWVVWDWRIGEYAQSILFMVYTAISAFGIYQWMKRGIK